MRCAGSVSRFFCALGILTIGFASAANAAGTDRKANRQERDNRVLIAARQRATANERSAAKVVQSDSPRINAVRQASLQTRYIQRLISAETYTLNYENGVLAAENRLIAKQNSVIRQLNVAVNPNLITRLAKPSVGASSVD